MYEGMLTINFDPPCLGFNNSAVSAIRHCTSEDIYALLLQLGVELPPVRDCYVRVQGSFSEEHLARFDLLPHLLPVRSAGHKRPSKQNH